MKTLAWISAALDAVNEAVGRTAWWLALALLLVQFTVVVLRYAFGTSFIVMQESVVYIHAALFMLGAGYTLLHDGHVRVDVFYSTASPRTRAWVDLVGCIVAVLPFCLLVIVGSWRYVSNSWGILEGPLNYGGIRAVYLLKTLIPVFGALLLLQAISVMLRAVLVLRGARDEVFPAPVKEGTA